MPPPQAPRPAAARSAASRSATTRSAATPGGTKAGSQKVQEAQEVRAADTETVDAQAVNAEAVDAPVDLPARSTALVPIHDPDGDAEPAGDQLRRSDVDEWGRSESFRRLARRLYDPMYQHWFRVEWEGLEHIPTGGGALLVANHAGAIPSDAPAIMHGIETELERPVYGLADEMFKKLPVVGTLWSRAGGVLAHPDNAYRLLREQQQLALVFPEGTKGTGKTYGERYQLRRFGRGGYVQIAMRAGVPIIPIAVVGAEETMPIVARNHQLAKLTGLPYVPLTANMLALGPVLGPLGALLWFPAKIRIRVLPPIHFDVEPDQHRYSRSRIMDESENVRQQIQEALYDMLRRRRSVWFG